MSTKVIDSGFEKLWQAASSNRVAVGSVFYYMVIYWVAIAGAYSLYKEYKRGYDHIATHLGYGIAGYFKDFSFYNPIPKGIRADIVNAIPLSVLLFVIVFIACRLLWKSKESRLPYSMWGVILTLHCISAVALAFYIGSAMVVIQLLTFPVFISLFFVVPRLVSLITRSMLICKDLLLNIEKISEISKKDQNAAAALFAAFFIYTVAASYLFNRYSIESILTSFLLVFIAVTVYVILGKDVIKGKRPKLALILLSYFVVSVIVFYSTIGNIWRSDYWLIATLFHNQDSFTFEAIKNIALFEMFGDIRFQPIAHLLMFTVHKIFGNAVVLYHLTNIALHAAVGLLVCALVYEFSEDTRFSFIFGLIFVVLPSQFDTVIWTYHIYIISCSIAVLAGTLYACRYAETDKMQYLVAAVFLATLAIFLYEPAILTPASIFFLVIGIYIERSEGPLTGITKERIIPVLFGVAISYALYLAVTAYGLTLTKGSTKMSLGDMLTLTHIVDSLGAVCMNLFESTLLKNIGISPDIKIRDIVYIYLPKQFFGDFVNIVKVGLGILLVSLFRVSKIHRPIVLTSIGLATSYLFVILLGRLLTNDLSYAMSQPRYQYFSNSILLTISGVLLWPKYQEKGFKTLINVLLLAIFFWNTQSILYASKKVSMAMKPMDIHYYKLKDFYSKNPEAKVFVDFIPDNNGRFFLGTDIALDLLFKENITKSIEGATHIYDGLRLVKNKSYNGGEASPYLKDFTLSWMYQHYPDNIPKKSIQIIGSEESLPMISMTPDGYVKVVMRNLDTDELAIYQVEHGYSPDERDPFLELWSSMVIEKNGDELCLIFNGKLEKKVDLKGEYRGWDKDGVSNLGGYYTGAGQVVFVARMFIQSDVAKYSCGEYDLGDKISVEIRKPW